MIRGVHMSVSAMKAQLARQEVLSNNLVNFFAPGYKQEAAAIGGFSAAVSREERRLDRRGSILMSGISTIGSLGTEVGLGRVSVDFRQGELQQTGRPLDVALWGDGFLRVAVADGVLYSRGGPLRLDGDGRLVTAEGYAVLGVEGEVILEGGPISIGSDGVVAVDGRPTAALSVVEFEPGTKLAKVGEDLYVPDGVLVAESTPATETLVKGGFLESSNVDHVSTLTEMISVLRAYQANQRMVQAQDELLQKAVNEVGKV